MTWRRVALPLLLVCLSALACGAEPPSASATRRPHHLVHEKSPYLLQHAYNPVDWYPWGDEAFARARSEDKPIFLSIGYSTCHWCHVMEHESFENDSVAALLNRWFICIKVDREERPDVDRVYMTAMQAMGQGGGWPLNVFVTPDLKPFFGGTYFPPDSRDGRPGLMQLLPRIHQGWVEQRANIERSGSQVLSLLANLAPPDTGSADPERLFRSAFACFDRSEDVEYGGLGNAPKFPSTGNLAFLMRYALRAPGDRVKAFAMVTRQLDAMRAGGIHDVLGGGFHRYSTDRQWQVPHFENMLYDQAQIAWAYLEAYQVTGNPGYAETARGIFTYVSRDLTSEAGAFYSAEDADSEGEEGRFYVWHPAQVGAVLDSTDTRLFDLRYGVTPEGNFDHHASILHEAMSVEEAAKRTGLGLADAARRLEQSRAKLLAACSRRVRPHRDDMVLTRWNGLMISAYARGARVLGDPSLATHATRAAEFVWRHLYDEHTGDLSRRWRDGQTAGAGQLSDYADLALGFVDLYESTYDPRWLARAARLTGNMVERFRDPSDGAFFDSPAHDPHLMVRLKDRFDGAEIAGNSIALFNLQLLGTLLDREEWRHMAGQGLDHFARTLSNGPAAMPQLLVAMDLAQSVPRHVVVVGDTADAATRRMLREFDRRFLPRDLLLLATTGATRSELEGLVAFVQPLVRLHGDATAYVCVNHACRLPTTDGKVFAGQLAAGGGSR